MSASLSASTPTPPPVVHKNVRVHVGSQSPNEWSEIERRQQEAGAEAADWLRNQQRPKFATDGIDWSAYGLTPCWVGDETTDCVAAIDPSQFSGEGQREHERFILGSRARGETALCVTVVDFDIDSRGRSRRDGSHSIFGTQVVSVPVIGHAGLISATRLGGGASMRIAENLSDTDQDLAVRLLSCADKLSLAALDLHGYEVPRGDYAQREYIEPAGHLEPILLASSDEPVAAVWTSDDGAERTYVLPHGTPVSQVLGWLSTRAIPELNPVAMRRALDPAAFVPVFPTSEEASLNAEIAVLDSAYQAERTSLARRYDAARASADPIRWHLLFGSGRDLEDAVAHVLKDAGMEVIDLDAALGSTKSADLLVRLNGRSRLVEVKSCKANASERIHDRFLSHVDRWPSDGAQFGPVEGGALIVNHELKTDPADRGEHPFTRSDLLASAPHPISGTIPLLDAWRLGDWGSVRALIFPGMVAAVMPSVGPSEAGGTSPPQPAMPDMPKPKRGRWSLRSGR